MFFSKLALAGTFAASVSAYSATQRTFAVNHFYGKGPLLTARVDPIINPGGPSSHVHTIQGGNAFAETMGDTTALDDSTCTSSLVKNDKSNYWTPSLYFVDPNNSSNITAVPMFYMNAYYFFEPTTDKIKAFQPGHRMVVGNPNLRTPPAGGGASILDHFQGTPQPIQMTCPRTSFDIPTYPVDSDGLHGVGIQDPHNKGAGAGFPDQNCDASASPLRLDVHFPSCYNPAVPLSDYKKNMDWPTNGNCPEGWIHTPHIFYEVYYDTLLFKDQWKTGQGKQPFVLANGDPTGYSLHGDFLSGWDVETLQQIIDNCDAGDSGMDKCPGLIGGVNDPTTSCNIVSPVNEVVNGSMSSLPGNNPIGQWGVNVAGGASSASSVVSSATSAIALKASSVAASVSSAVSSVTGSASGVVSSVVSVATSASSLSIPSVTTHTNTLIYKTMTVTAGQAHAAQPTGSSTLTSAPATISGYSYAGCYADQESSRVLSGIEFADVGIGKVSNSACVAYCEAKGFGVAGTEYGGQCFCGSGVPNQTLDESKCNMKCEGNESEVCGGGMALSVYSKGSASKVKRVSRHLHKHARRSY